MLSGRGSSADDGATAPGDGATSPLVAYTEASPRGTTPCAERAPARCGSRSPERGRSESQSLPSLGASARLLESADRDGRTPSPPSTGVGSPPPPPPPPHPSRAAPQRAAAAGRSVTSSGDFVPPPPRRQASAPPAKQHGVGGGQEASAGRSSASGADNEDEDGDGVRSVSAPPAQPGLRKEQQRAAPRCGGSVRPDSSCGLSPQGSVSGRSTSGVHPEESRTAHSELTDEGERHRRAAAASEPSEDPLVVHRVTRFTMPHELDRSEMDPALEQEFIRLLQVGEVQEAMDVMRRHVVDRKLLLTSAALSAAVNAGNFGLVKAMILFPMVDFTTRNYAIVAQAVRRSELALVKLLLVGPLTDVNTGAPLALAVENGDADMVRVLSECERINPNKGGALYRCIEQGDMEILDLLLRNNRLNINKLPAGFGTTALCRAITLQNLPAVQRILQHPRIDLNRGFLLTPLQHAVDTRNIGIVRVLLSASNPRSVIDVNKKLGPSLSPLARAVDGDVCMPVVRLLLSDSRCLVDDALLQRVEEKDLVDVAQAIVDSGRSLEIAAVWEKRVVQLITTVPCSVIAQLLTVVMATMLLFVGMVAQGATSFILLAVACGISTLLLYQRAARPHHGTRWLRLFPIMYDVDLLFSCLCAVYSGRAPKQRSQLHDTLQLNILCTLVFVSVPQVLMQTVLLGCGGIASDDGSGVVAVTYACLAAHLVFGVREAANRLSAAGLRVQCRELWTRGRRRWQMGTDSADASKSRYTLDSYDGSRRESTGIASDMLSTGLSFVSTAGTSSPQMPQDPGSLLTVYSATSTDMSSTRSCGRKRTRPPPQLDLSLVQPEGGVMLPPRVAEAERRNAAARQQQQQQPQQQPQQPQQQPARGDI